MSPTPFLSQKKIASRAGWGTLAATKRGHPLTLKSVTLASICALGLLVAVPQGAGAQDANFGGAPVTVRIIDPPVETPPPPGISYIRFGTHEVEVNGPVRFTNDKVGKTVLLPDGAPPLPADLFDAITLPDGRVAYTARTQDRVIIFATIKASDNPIPAPFAATIEMIGDVPQTKLGVLHKGDTVLSIPYRYKHPLRMSDDLAINSLFGTMVLATRDEVGFDAGEFSSGTVPHRLLCFFNPKRSNPYMVPDCFVKFPAPDGSFGLNQVIVTNNLPTQFVMSKFEVTGAKAPPVESEAVTIDHDFHLDLVVGWWSDEGVELTWRTEGVCLQTQKVKLQADGTVRLRIKGGWIVLRGDPRERVKTLAEFVSDAEALMP